MKTNTQFSGAVEAAKVMADIGDGLRWHNAYFPLNERGERCGPWQLSRTLALAESRRNVS